MLIAEFAALAVCRLARSKNLRSDIGYSDGVTPLMGLLAVHEEHGARPPALLKNVLLALVSDVGVRADVFLYSHAIRSSARTPRLF